MSSEIIKVVSSFFTVAPVSEVSDHEPNDLLNDLLGCGKPLPILLQDYVLALSSAILGAIELALHLPTFNGTGK